MNIGVQAFVWMYAFIYLGKLPGSEMIDLYGRCVVIWKENLLYCFPKWLYNFALPPVVWQF